MSKLIKDFTGEYGGLLAEILTRRELLKYYVENGFDDNDLEKKA